MSNDTKTGTSTTYDIKITGGTIVDGSGASGYRGDVAIKEGKVVALGQAPGTAAATTIDAADRMVTPASCATPVCPPICWAAGCATNKPSRSRKPSAC